MHETYVKSITRHHQSKEKSSPTELHQGKIKKRERQFCNICGVRGHLGINFINLLINPTPAPKKKEKYPP